MPTLGPVSDPGDEPTSRLSEAINQILRGGSSAPAPASPEPTPEPEPAAYELPEIVPATLDVPVLPDTSERRVTPVNVPPLEAPGPFLAQGTQMLRLTPLHSDFILRA